MTRRQCVAACLLSLLGCITVPGCSDDGEGTTPSPSRSELCDSCSWLLHDQSLWPQAVLSDESFVYVLKSRTGEIVRVPVAGGSMQTVTSQLPEPVAMSWVRGTLWVRCLDDSIHRIDARDGSVMVLRSIEGLYDIQAGPGGTPVVSRQANGHAEVVSLSVEDATDGAILWAQDGSEYFSSFAASPEGVAWIASTDMTDRLHFLAAGTAEPLVTAVRAQSPIAGTLAISGGSVYFLGKNATKTTTLFEFSGANVLERASAQGAMRLTALGSHFMITATDRLSVSALNPTSGVIATETLSEALNIYPVADSRYVYLPLKSALAAFARSAPWQ